MGAWPCGHVRTTENTQSVGKAGFRCRTCRRLINLKYWHKTGKFSRAAITAATGGE